MVNPWVRDKLQSSSCHVFQNIRHIKKYMEREDSTMIEGEEGQKEREQTVYNILKWK